MKKFLFAAAVAAITVAATPASAVTISFDEIGAGSLTNQYAGLGVTFADAVVANYGALPGNSAPNVVTSPFGTTFGSNSPIRASFSSLTQFVSFTAVDLGAAGIRVDGFDANGQLLGFSEAFGTGIGIGEFAEVSFSAANIASIRIYQVLNGATIGDGVAIDNFSFGLGSAPAVPEPATWAIMLIGFGLVGAAVRRQSKALLIA